ncbi:MAG: MFS transporter [Bacilli bacterium]
MKMITRFSLYGFLKNFDFSKPFIILFYLSLGLNYFKIGILVAFLNICINIMEIPSGAFADLYGRKTSMIISLSSYFIAFAVFSISNSLYPLFIALFFYSIGEAFRTGTHKAIIFDWLKSNNRLFEKTKIYGYTRSWSNYGSAISVLLAALIVILTNNFRLVFLFSMIPALFGIWNMICYPNYLDRRQQTTITISQILKHTKDSIIKAVKHSDIKILIIQNMSFEGCFDVSKDYLQPILQTQALMLTSYIALPEKQNTALVVGIVYFILHMVSAASSKNSYKFASKFSTKRNAIIFLIFLGSLLVFVSSISIFFKIFIISIICYSLYFLIQNLWVPILVAQYDDFANSSEQATILSIASQAKTIGIAILAPITGLLADNLGIQFSLLLLSIILIILGLYSTSKNKLHNVITK